MKKLLESFRSRWHILRPTVRSKLSHTTDIIIIEESSSIVGAKLEIFLSNTQTLLLPYLSTVIFYVSLFMSPRAY